MVFQAAQLIDLKSSPILALFYSDASFAGQHMSHHPIYSKQPVLRIIFIIYYYFDYFDYLLSFTVSLLNLHEDERSKPSSWIPVAWLPIYDDKRDKRPGTGFTSSSARKMRLYHQCWIEFLDKWAERTKDAVLVSWADGVSRMSRYFIGGLLGDQQESDKFTAEPCACHRCKAPRHSFLDTEDFQTKTTKMSRNKVQLAAEGAFLDGKHANRWIVRWDADGRNVRPGPGYFHYYLLFRLF